MPRQTPDRTMDSSVEDAPMPLYLRLKQMITGLNRLVRNFGLATAGQARGRLTLSISPRRK